MRTRRGTPARPAARIPAPCGRRLAPSRRAARTTTATSATAMPAWASTEPTADPASSRRGTGPAPYTSATLSTRLATLPSTATARGVRVSCSPRSTPSGRERQEERGDAGGRDAEVRRRSVLDVGRRPEQGDQGVREEAGEEGDRDADRDREPEAVDALGECGPAVAGAELAGDACRRAVGEEDAEADDRGQHGPGESEARELASAEVADDGRVAEQEQTARRRVRGRRGARAGRSRGRARVVRRRSRRLSPDCS